MLLLPRRFPGKQQLALRIDLCAAAGEVAVKQGF